MRTIILRFDSNNPLILKVDKVAKILGNKNAGITRIALNDYCDKILNNGKKKNAK